MFICVNCPLEVTLKHSNLLQGVQAILSTSQSHYLDVSESWTPCVWMQRRFYGYSMILSDRNSDKQDKEDQGQNRPPWLGDWQTGTACQSSASLSLDCSHAFKLWINDIMGVMVIRPKGFPDSHCEKPWISWPLSSAVKPFPVQDGFPG